MSRHRGGLQDSSGEAVPLADNFLQKTARTASVAVPNGRAGSAILRPVVRRRNRSPHTGRDEQRGGSDPVEFGGKLQKAVDMLDFGR